MFDRGQKQTATRFKALLFRAAHDPDLGEVCRPELFPQYKQVAARHEIVGRQLIVRTEHRVAHLQHRTNVHALVKTNLETTLMHCFILGFLKQHDACLLCFVFFLKQYSRIVMLVS